MTKTAPSTLPRETIAGIPFTPDRNSSKRRVALLGTGYIADWHAKALASVRDVELVAVCDRVAPRAEAFAQKHGVPNAYGSLEAMMERERLDSVHILLPPDMHFQAARTILNTGVGVFMEKPMCDQAADCDSLVRLAEDRGIRLGVGHNFLFSEPYEQLRRDLREGVLGRIDHVTITWNRELPQVSHGPFDIWMLRDPRNIMIEIGSHSVAHMLDLVGSPEEFRVYASNPVELLTGVKFYRRWQVNAFQGQTALDLRFSFAPGFAEYSIHVRGSLAAATVDFERNNYILHRHGKNGPDLDNYRMVRHQAGSLERQGRRTLTNYVKSKLKLCARGNPFGASIARALDSFYGGNEQVSDPRIEARMGARVIRLCKEIGAKANVEQRATLPENPAGRRQVTSHPRILVLGGSGFIGKELVQQLADGGHGIRLLVRNPANLPRQLRAEVACETGDITCEQDLRQAMTGIDYVYHLARANVKTWEEYQKQEIEVTRRIARCALNAGVKRLIYTGTIDSYYAGGQAGTITEETPLDPRVARRNLYARAKAVSEEILMRMHREQSLPVVILRPGIVIGRGGSPLHWGVGMWWQNSVCQIWGEGRNTLPLVLVEDVAKALVAAMEQPGIEGQSFNLVGDPCLSARDYLDELDRCGGIRIQRHYTPIVRFYLADLFKWMVKLAVRHPERRLPMYRDWESRTQKAIFDCSAAKLTLAWRPVTDRSELIRRGIEHPLSEIMR